MTMPQKKREETIRYVGEPRVSEAGKEVVAFHLHRYLSIWLRRHGLDRILVSVGFQGSSAETVTYAVGPLSAQVMEARWSFEDLCHTHQYGGGCLRLEGAGGEEGCERLAYVLIPVYDEGREDGHARSTHPALLAFALLVDGEGQSPPAESDLCIQIAEALRAARRNSMRLFFDEMKHLPMKAFLYGLMDHLPEWAGCDHSASLILTANLDAMTLERGGEARFGILAERVFFPDPGEDVARLVGMEIGAGRESGLLGHGVEAQRRDPGRAFHVYRRSTTEPRRWSPREAEEPGLDRFHDVRGRPEESTFILVPLTVEEGGEHEMLGFLCLANGDDVDLPPSARALLEELGAKLSDVLRYSPLYMLSAHKMWILGQTRSALERTLKEGGRGRSESVEAYIGEVANLISRHVDVPSFAIAYLSTAASGSGGADRGRSLRYVHPHGWTHFEGLDLAIDVEPDARADSGVSALAVRLARPLILAGGHGEGEAQRFKNHLFVDEEGARVMDGRSVHGREEQLHRSWVPLKDYYKPARKTAYATLAYPVVFADIVLGVVTIEVERDTDWLWWTGFGGQLFWQWLATDLAYAFHTLRVGCVEA
ncbi:MAG: hypothetical protein ACNA8W_03610 [Bradymonadaceae bacterium]